MQQQESPRASQEYGVPHGYTTKDPGYYRLRNNPAARQVLTLHWRGSFDGTIVNIALRPS